MSLRARLTAAFTIAVLIPLALAGVLVLGSVTHSADRRIEASVAAARTVGVARLQAACEQASAAASLLAQESAGGPRADGSSPATPDAIRQATGVDAIARLDLSGAIVASSYPAGAPSDAAARLLNANDCRAGRVASVLGTVVARQPFRAAGASGLSGTAVAAVSIAAFGANPGILDQLLDGTAARTTLLLPGINPTGSDVERAGEFAAHFPANGPDDAKVKSVGGFFASGIALQGGAQLVVSEPKARPTGVYMAFGVGALVLLLAALAAGAYFARRVTFSLNELIGAARKVVAGDLSPSLAETPGTEIGELGAAFNQLTRSLRETTTDLQLTREELRRGVSRLGNVLSGTHDLDRILAVILDTAVASVRAEAGVLLLTASSGESLYIGVARGLDGRIDGDTATWTVSTGGNGVVARVATTGVVVRGVVGQDFSLASDEPRADLVLAVPMRSAGRITGVLCLYDRTDGRPFDEPDVEAVSDFVNQATSAVDNVLMHHETQRLSVTDGLTGLWNRRYASRALEREVERSQRYGHPLSVLMLDLDRFKQVNDKHGHQRGDAVLIELAARVREVVREVDIVARYGGEEFILILPETDLAGARLLSSRILDGIRVRPMGGPGEEAIWMTTSIGVAVMPTHGDSAESLIRAADTALYAAKSSGRDTFRIAAPLDPPAEVSSSRH